MSIKAATLMVDVDVDTAKAEKKVTSFGNAMKGLATGMAMGAGMGLFNAIADGAQGAVAGMSEAVKAASDLSETINMMNVVMGQSSAAVLAWSKNSATALGMTQNQALTAAGTFAAFGKSSGMAGEELTQFSTDLVGLAADLGSFYNTSPEEAITAIGAALRGEMEPIRRYNVMLDDMSLRQEAVRLKITATTKEALSPQQKILATNSLLWKATADAQGDFANTSGGLAGQQKILTANMDALSVSVGNALLPAMTALTSAGNDLVTAVLPSLGSLIETYVAPAAATFAENISIGAENLGTFMDAVALGADPLGAFIDAFNLEPWADTINDAIGYFEWLQNEWNTEVYNMTLATQTWSRDFIVQLNIMRAALNEFSAAGNDWFNWFGENAAKVTGNPWTASEPTEWTQQLDVPGITAVVPDPVSLDRIPTSGWRGVDSQAAPGGYGYAAQQNQKNQAAAAESAGDLSRGLKGTYSEATIAAGRLSGLGDAASKAGSDLATALGKIPGLFGTSKVTQGDMDRAAAGLPVNFADDYVRQAGDELLNGIDYANIDPAEVAASVGLDPSVPAQIIMDELTKQWESGEYFANPENLAKINWQAVKDAALKEANAVLGQQNIIAEALAQGISVESFKPLATDSMADMAVALTAATTTPENKVSLENAGAAAAEQYYGGWKGWMAEAPVVPPSGLPSGPPATPPGVPVSQGPQWPTITSNGVTMPLTFTEPVTPRGGRSIPADQTGAFGNNTTVTVNATVANNYDMEKLAVRVASVIKSKRRGI